MTLQLNTARAYDKGCYGCQKHGKDIMIAITYEGDPNRHGVHDLFLTQEMAEFLLRELTDAVDRNKVK